LIFAITSKGRCSHGVMEILENLPITVIPAGQMADLVKNKEDPAHRSTIYVTYIETEHMVRPRDPKEPYSKKEYYASPDKYEACFHELYLPYISCIFHCMYWDEKYQRMITNEQMKRLAVEGRSRLLGICDVTCDLEGSIEFLKKYTSIDHPFFLYNPITEERNDDLTKCSTDILYHAVDHLPTELAWDATTHFGQQLAPFLENLAMSDIRKPFEENGLHNEMKKAVITHNGELTENFKYIIKLRAAKEDMRKKQAFSAKVPKPLGKEMSFISLKLEGHLFDTYAINKIFDELEKVNVHFRVLDVEIGLREGNRSYAYIQIFNQHRESFSLALEKINLITEQFGIKTLE